MSVSKIKLFSLPHKTLTVWCIYTRSRCAVYGVDSYSVRIFSQKIGFLQFLYTNTNILHRLGHDRVLTSPFQFIIHLTTRCQRALMLTVVKYTTNNTVECRHFAMQWPRNRQYNHKQACLHADNCTATEERCFLRGPCRGVISRDN
jgi:hypothetical protein